MDNENKPHSGCPPEKKNDSCENRLKKYYEPETDKCKSAKDKNKEKRKNKKDKKNKPCDDSKQKGGGKGEEDEHEHPCICDVRLKRKALTLQEIHKKFRYSCGGSDNGGNGKSKNGKDCSKKSKKSKKSKGTGTTPKCPATDPAAPITTTKCTAKSMVQEVDMSPDIQVKNEDIIPEESPESPPLVEDGGNVCTPGEPKPKMQRCKLALLHNEKRNPINWKKNPSIPIKETKSSKLRLEGAGGSKNK